MTQDQITLLLGLSSEWRRRLTEQEGPGWWATNQGTLLAVERMANDPTTGVSAKWALRMAWAWAPCDSLAWLRATGASWRVLPNATQIGEGMSPAAFQDPIDAALAFMAANPCPK